MQNKLDLRRSLLAARRAIPDDQRARWNAAITTQILDWWAANQVRTLGVYWPIRGEPDLRPAYADLAARGVRLTLPVVVDQNAPLRFAEWSPGDPLVKDAMGVSIPASLSDQLQPEALLVPCVGFNAERIRLGYGGGFYDRTLAASPRPNTIGIAYACGAAVFDAAPHDIELDVIITEQTSLAFDTKFPR